MSKVQEIIEGWKNLLVKNSVIEDVAVERSEECAKCENVHLVMGRFYLHCKKCGCYIPAKIRSKSSRCPNGLWKR